MTCGSYLELVASQDVVLFGTFGTYLYNISFLPIKKKKKIEKTSPLIFMWGMIMVINVIIYLFLLLL